MSRLPSVRGPVCHDGFEKILLTPPPLQPHAASIPPGATPITLVSLPEPSYEGENCVPPTAVTCGLPANSLGFRPVPVTQLLLVELYCSPAAPQSPELTNTDWPCAAASEKYPSRPVKNEFVELQKIKLTLIAPQTLSVIAEVIEVSRLAST